MKYTKATLRHIKKPKLRELVCAEQNKLTTSGDRAQLTAILLEIQKQKDTS